MTSDAEIIERAIDVLHEGGWKQGSYGDFGTDVPHCAVGALCTAMVLLGDVKVYAVSRARGIEDRFITNLIGGPGVGLTVWNDKVGRTADDVVHLFKQAAEEARSREL